MNKQEEKKKLEEMRGKRLDEIMDELRLPRDFQEMLRPLLIEKLLDPKFIEMVKQNEKNLFD